MFALASGLSDHDLLDRIAALAGKERETSAELVAHLAALDARPSSTPRSVMARSSATARACLHLSEDAACNRIDVARACRRFPVILDGLASGALSLTTVRLLRPHLTPENHEAVLAEASGPEPGGRTGTHRPASSASRRAVFGPEASPPASAVTASAPMATTPARGGRLPADRRSSSCRLHRRPIIEPTSPERYRVQFTVGQDTHDKLRRLQALLRREIPSGDPGAIFDRAITLLLEKVERAKIGRAAKPRPIRPGTDSHSRHIAERIEARGLAA